MAAPLRAVLTDIEGTTTSISFVYDVLFPYAAARLEKACRTAEAHAAGERLRAEDQEEERETARVGKKDGAEPLPDFGDGVPYARYLMGLDRKSTGLKALQGLIWEEGYRSGEIQGHVFEDVPPALRRWRDTGLRLRVFSS